MDDAFGITIMDGELYKPVGFGRKTVAVGYMHYIIYIYVLYYTIYI